MDLSLHSPASANTSTRMGDPNHRNIFEIGSAERFQELGRVFEVEKVGEDRGKIQFHCPDLDETVFGDQWSDDWEVYLTKGERRRLSDGKWGPE